MVMKVFVTIVCDNSDHKGQMCEGGGAVLMRVGSFWGVQRVMNCKGGKARARSGGMATIVRTLE